ncbi:MAG: hypothetical protein JRI41_02930 [Deltaproteobacteria bacterium]|nr:hypothetical protein [Deltaproteobacteria bacterium]
MSREEAVIEEVDMEDKITDDSKDLEKTDDELREEERQAEQDVVVDELSSEDDSVSKEGSGEPPRFTLATQEEAQGTEDKDGPELIDIVHNGQAHRLTKEKLIELAQKGFDYDYKVGPHGKLVEMIDSDPELAQLINDHWQKKLVGPEVNAAGVEALEITPLDDYEDEAEWLKANIANAIKHDRARNPQPVVQQPVQNPAIDALRMRDPEHFDSVVSKLGEYAGQLTVDDYNKVDNDMSAFIKFYDFVKERVVSDAAGKQSSTRRASTKKPSFRVKSGGGEVPRSGSLKDAAWKLSRADFQKQLDKIKGYG